MVDMDTVMAMSSSKRLDDATFLSSMPSNNPKSMTFQQKRSGKSLGFGLSLLAVASIFATNSKAQQADAAGSGRNFTVTPRVSLTETYSDNVNLSSTNRQSEFTTEISPGIRIASDAGRLKGSFDYSLTQVLYAKNSDKNELQNSLNAAGSYEAIDNWAFLDFGSTIAQRSISAFGAQSLNNTNLNSNRTEVSTYRLSPYIRGHFSSFADYEIRYRLDSTKSKSSLISDVDTKESSIRLNGDTSFSKLRWSSDLVDQNIDYSAGRNISSDRLNINLTYAVDPQLDVILIGGREENNYTSLNKEGHNSKGLGLNWRVSDMTKISGQTERRYFGSTHNFNFEHRTPRTAWSYTDSKSVSTSTATASGTTSLASVVYALLYNQLATLEPDPIKRAELVRAYLVMNGFDPTASVTSDYSTSTLSLQRSQVLSFTLMGVRDTVTVAAARTTGQLLGTASTITGDFSSTSFIRQNGVTMSYSHRLTPDSSLGLSLTQQKSVGNSSSLQTKLRSLNVNLATRFAEKVYGNFGARHTISDGSSSSYKENALTGSVNIQF